jgi:hypothetical protein
MANRSQFLIAAIFILGLLSGCSTEQRMKDITQVSHTSDSGAILPELQWHEEYVISDGAVTFSRNGKVAETQVNAGTWQIALDGQQTAELFGQLETVDIAAIQRVEPQDAPDGGGSASYTVAYAGGKTFNLSFDAGVVYTNSEPMLEPIHRFIQNLVLPAEAANRYNLAQP